MPINEGCDANMAKALIGKNRDVGEFIIYPKSEIVCATCLPEV